MKKFKAELGETNTERNSSFGKFFIFCLIALIVFGGILIVHGAWKFQNGNPGFTAGLAFAGGLVLLFLATYVLIWCVTLFNKLVTYNNKINESLALIDIHLKLRFDLIPNLVETVKGYAKHEQTVLKELTELRALASVTKSEKKKIEYANYMVPKIRQLVVLSENYPELKANTVYISLMQELVVVEDKIVTSRRIYDSNVSEFNTLIMSFPSNLVAKMFDFKKAELFRIDAGERLNIKVSL